MPRPVEDEEIKDSTESKRIPGYYLYRKDGNCNIAEAQGQLDSYCTAWTSALYTIIWRGIGSMRDYSCKSLRLMSVFLEHGADINALSHPVSEDLEHTDIRIRFQDLPLEIRTKSWVQMNARATIHTLYSSTVKDEDTSFYDYSEKRRLFHDLVEMANLLGAEPKSVLKKTWYWVNTPQAGLKYKRYSDGFYLIPTTMEGASLVEKTDVSLDSGPCAYAGFQSDSQLGYSGQDKAPLRYDREEIAKLWEAIGPGPDKMFKRTCDYEHAPGHALLDGWIHSRSLSLGNALPFALFGRVNRSPPRPFIIDPKSLVFEDAKADLLGFVSMMIRLIGEAQETPQLINYKVSKIQRGPDGGDAVRLLVSGEAASTVFPQNTTSCSSSQLT